MEQKPNVDNTLLPLKQEAKACYKCRDIANRRMQIVFGDGLNIGTGDITLLGEASGQSEDLSGKPFVGKSGQLLTNILEEKGLFRGKNYAITNLLQCRPKNNATPTPEEIENCSHFLHEKIKYLKPKVILLIGGTAANAILKTELPISQLRGIVYDVEIAGHKCKAIPTYHPNFLLRVQDKFPLKQTKSDIDLLNKTIKEINEAQFAAAV